MKKILSRTNLICPIPPKLPQFPRSFSLNPAPYQAVSSGADLGVGRLGEGAGVIKSWSWLQTKLERPDCGDQAAESCSCSCGAQAGAVAVASCGAGEL